MSVQKTEMLSDKLSSLLNSTPGIIDPEDDIYEDTTAKLVENEFSDEDNSALPSKFRKENALLLDVDDDRYAGIRVSRKSLNDDGSESGSDSISQEEEDSTREEVLDDESDLSDDEIDNDHEDLQTDSELNQSDPSEETVPEISDSPLKHLQGKSLASEVAKGNCVKQQLLIWQNLMEMRIKLQKSLVSANKLPQNNQFFNIKDNSSEEYLNKLAAVQNSTTQVLDKLLDLQSQLLKSYPKTKNLNNKSNKNEKYVASDEEIPSDTENDESNNEEETEVTQPPVKKRKILSEYEAVISEQHNLYKPYRNYVITKWNEKTRMPLAKNAVNSNSVVNQIEYVLKDRSKYIRRTQMKRTNYKIIGIETSELNTDNSKGKGEFNTEIFDDDDFYHQLLKELIEFKSADITDPVKLSRQWIELQSMRSKMKRMIDTKATKGRKIRYAVHSKLINFMAPILENNWTDEAKTELYNSLFER